MISKEEVERIFEATKKELDKIVEADTPRTGLQEDKRVDAYRTTRYMSLGHN